MKGIKKLVAFLTVVSMLLVSGSLFVGAQELSPRDYLIQTHGLPADVVDTMRPESLQRLYESTFGQDVDVSYKTESFEVPDVGPQTRGSAIEDSKLKLSVFYVNYYTNAHALDRVFVMADFDWLKIPAVIHTDTIKIGWNASLLHLNSNTFRSYCYFKGSGMPAAVQTSNSTSLRATAQGALAYDVFCGASSMVDEWYGSANFNLYPSTTIIRNSGVACSMDMNYMHDGNPFGAYRIGVTIAGTTINLAEGMFNYPRAISHPWTVNE